MVKIRSPRAALQVGDAYQDRLRRGRAHRAEQQCGLMQVCQWFSRAADYPVIPGSAEKYIFQKKY
eukprot:SAG11_NODE_717_length_7606_cov_5.968563_9_plen_65_part_00